METLESELFRIAEGVQDPGNKTQEESITAHPIFRIEPQSSTVIIRNIPCTVTAQEIRAEISRFSKIEYFEYLPDRPDSGSDGGVAVVTAENARDLLDLTLPNLARPLSITLTNEKRFEVLPSDPLEIPSSFWREHKTADGFAYFHNEQTGDTVWEKPEGYLEIVRRHAKVYETPDQSQWSLYVFNADKDQTAFLEKSRSLLARLECTRNFLENVLVLTFRDSAGREMAKTEVERAGLRWGVRPGEE